MTNDAKPALAWHVAGLSRNCFIYVHGEAMAAIATWPIRTVRTALLCGSCHQQAMFLDLILAAIFRPLGAMI
jgi:hypothetical protein